MFIAHFVINIMILFFEITLRASTQLSSFSRNIVIIYFCYFLISHIYHKRVLYSHLLFAHTTWTQELIVELFWVCSSFKPLSAISSFHG